MKKILIFLLIIITSLITIQFKAYGFEVNLDDYVETRIDNLFGDWTYVWESNNYYLRSEKKQFDISYLDIDFINRDLRPVTSTPLYFQYPYEITNSSIEVYSSSSSTAPLLTYNFIDSGDGLHGYLQELVEVDNSLYYQMKIKMHPKTYSYGEQGIFQTITEVMSLANQNGLMNDYPVLPLVIKAYSTVKVLDPSDIEFINTLPITPGSLFHEPHLMYDVTVSKIGNDIKFTINNNGVPLEFTKTFANDTDFSIFNNAYEIKYYTFENQRFMIFNHGSESLFYVNEFDSSPFIPKKYPSTFIPYTIWNIGNNELSKIDKFDVYLYAKEESANNVYGYFYVDSFVIDNLISVTTTIEYRYKSIIGTVGEWTTVSKVLEDTNLNPGNLDWKLQAAAISSTATIIGSMIPGIGLPLLIIGTPISLYLQYLSYQELIDGNMLWTGYIDEIQQINVSDDLLLEVNTSYQNMYPSFSQVDTTGTFKLWKLHLGTFNKPFQSGIEFSDKNGVNIIQFKYQTNGMLYTIEKENINLNFDPGELVEKEPNPSLFDFSIFGKYSTTILIVGGIIILFLVIPKLEKGFNSITRIISNPKLIIFIALVVIAIFLYLGKK